jgi:hypothetical protein
MRISITEPRSITSPAATSAHSPGPIARSATRVPFALPRSLIRIRGPRLSIACLREIDPSSIRTSASTPRPITTSPAGGSENRSTSPSPTTRSASPSPPRTGRASVTASGGVLASLTL